MLELAHYLSQEVLRMLMAGWFFVVSYIYVLIVFELSDFFNNPSLVEIGPLKFNTTQSLGCFQPFLFICFYQDTK